MCVWCVYSLYVCVVCVQSVCMCGVCTHVVLESFDLVYCPKVFVVLFPQQKAIVDVCWCPWNALMFATASTGRIEVWDLSVNM